VKHPYIRTAAGFIAAAVLFSLGSRAASVPAVSAKHAVLMDCQSGRVLYEQDSHSAARIASTTKIMTAIVVLECCDLQSEVAVPKAAVGVEGSSLYLKEGEILTVEELLYGLMLHSGNDAAVALAQYCAGSVEAFSDKMNDKAEELQLENTHFVNPHGLDEEAHYSSAYDLAVLTSYALQNDDFLRIVSTRQVTVGGRTLTNHNKMLWQYDGAVGVKTGYTKAAGRILVSAAEKNGRTLVAVTIHDPRDWEDHKKLLDYGFNQFPVRTIMQASDVVKEVPVIGGAEETVQAVTGQDIQLPAADYEETTVVSNLPLFVYAPVFAGERAGTITVYLDGAEAASYPVYWRFSVLEDG